MPFLLHTIHASWSEGASLYIIQTYSTERRTVTIPHFFILSNRVGEAYPWLTSAERLLCTYSSIIMRLWASGRWGTISAFVQRCYCTLAVYCTEWQCENHVKIPPGLWGNQALTGTMRHFFLFLLLPNQKKMPRLMLQRLRAQTNATFWGHCFVLWAMHTVWVMSRMCTACFCLGLSSASSSTHPKPQQRMRFIVMMDEKEVLGDLIFIKQIKSYSFGFVYSLLSHLCKCQRMAFAVWAFL